MYDLRSSPMILAPSARFLTEFPFSLMCLPGHSKGPGEKEIKALVSNFALGEPRRLLPSSRPPRPGGGGVPLEEEAAKLSLGNDPTEKEGGKIQDDILGGGGGGEARWPEDLSTASDQRHDAKRKGPHSSKSSAPPTLSRAEAALDSISDLHDAPSSSFNSHREPSQTCISHGGRGGAPHHTSISRIYFVFFCFEIGSLPICSFGVSSVYDLAGLIS